MTEHGTFSIRESFGGVRPLVEVMDEFAAAGLDAVVDREGMGALFLRAEDCERLLTTRGFAAVAMPVLEMSGVSDGPLHDLWSVLMFGKDGAEHRRIRGAVARYYTAGAVAGQERFVGDLAGRLAGALPSGAAFDLWDRFALPLAGGSVCRLVGLPAEDVDRATAWSLGLVAAFGALSVEARSRATPSTFAGHPASPTPSAPARTSASAFTWRGSFWDRASPHWPDARRAWRSPSRTRGSPGAGARSTAWSV